MSTAKGLVIKFDFLTNETKHYELNQNKNPIDYIFVRNKKIFTVCYTEKCLMSWDESFSIIHQHSEINVTKLNQILPLPNDLIAYAANNEYGVFNFKTNKVYNSAKSPGNTEYYNICKGTSIDSLYFRAYNGEVCLYNYINNLLINRFHIKYNFGINSLLKTSDNKLITIMNKDIYVMDMEGGNEKVHINSLARNGLLQELLDKRIIYSSRDCINLLDMRTGNKEVLKIEGVPSDLIQFNEFDLILSTNDSIYRWDLRGEGIPYYSKKFNDNIVKVWNSFSKELDYSC